MRVSESLRSAVVTVLCAGVFWSTPAGFVFAAVDEHRNLKTYEGSATCTPCHMEEAREVHASAHYQWKGKTPQVPDLGFAGKLGGINDFCTYPNLNFLFLMTNLGGATVGAGCAACHPGMGAKPQRGATAEQPANVDCLLCHSDAYKRVAVKQTAGMRFVPDPP